MSKRVAKVLKRTISSCLQLLMLLIPCSSSCAGLECELQVASATMDFYWFVFRCAKGVEVLKTVP